MRALNAGARCATALPDRRGAVVVMMSVVAAWVAVWDRCGWHDERLDNTWPDPGAWEDSKGFAGKSWIDRVRSTH